MLTNYNKSNPNLRNTDLIYRKLINHIIISGDRLYTQLHIPYIWGLIYWGSECGFLSMTHNYMAHAWAQKAQLCKISLNSIDWIGCRAVLSWRDSLFPQITSLIIYPNILHSIDTPRSSQGDQGNTAYSTAQKFLWISDWYLNEMPLPQEQCEFCVFKKKQKNKKNLSHKILYTSIHLTHNSCLI